MLPQYCGAIYSAPTGLGVSCGEGAEAIPQGREAREDGVRGLGHFEEVGSQPCSSSRAVCVNASSGSVFTQRWAPDARGFDHWVGAMPLLKFGLMLVEMGGELTLSLVGGDNPAITHEGRSRSGAEVEAEERTVSAALKRRWQWYDPCKAHASWLGHLAGVPGSGKVLGIHVWEPMPGCSP